MNKMNPEEFQMENSFIHNGISNDVYIRHDQAVFPYSYKYPVVGYCDSMDVKFRPKRIPLFV